MRKFLCLRALVAIVIATLGVSDSFAQTGVEEQLVFLGTTMTKENGNNLDPEHKWVKSGTVKYDADTRTITLENAEIVVTKENCPQYQSESGTWYPVIGTFRFYCPVDKITVKLIGKNSIKTTQTGFVMLTYQEAEAVNIDMIGGGSLTIDAGLNGIDDRHTGLLTIKDVDMNIRADRCGICGGYTSRLTVDNSNVKSEAKYGAICSFRKFSMKGVKCVSPVPDPNATEEDKKDPNSTKTVSFDKGGVTNAYGTPWDIAVLVRETAGIDAKPSVKNNATVVAVYDVSGRLLKDLQKGTNIVRYSDGSVKKVIK
ncbi:hypothetical protein [Prevotella nigrescens]|uniref:hypothetical protein n=1 Tax=Prevotella nigrescens TaxID=28133 RepID=UPI0028899E3D|nr:hypothetical protein [Prevotella nigrescens]